MVIEKVKMHCPLCGEVHEVEKVREKEKMIYKGEEVEYEVDIFTCEKDPEHSFETEDMFSENMRRLREAYKKKLMA